MPRYSYQCTECTEIIIVFHRINETYVDCEICRSKQCMEKILSTPTIKKQNRKDNKKVGELTKEYIEMNRKILEEEKLKRDPNGTP
jgi:putative FmdB family regulatory protein